LSPENPTPSPRPGALRRLFEAWKRLGRRLATFQARVLLTLFYFVVLAPFALVLRLTSDPLALRRGAAGKWRPREADDPRDPLARARDQS
jgi:hypothetical protein